MGQAIVTSHSPYVIERFDPGQIVVLKRDDTGTLTSCTIVLGEDLKPKKYREQRRQFAEAVLANAVLVVEGGTELAAFLAAAEVLAADPATRYRHPDVAGLSLFDAGGDTRVPLYGPIFADMGKKVFGVHDTPTVPFTTDQAAKAQSFEILLDTGYPGIEDLLVNEIPPDVLRKCLARVAGRSDYPQQCGTLPSQATDQQVISLARELLVKRKGQEGFAPLLIAECDRSQLPATLARLLLDIDAQLTADLTSSSDSGSPRVRRRRR
jgi:putative ATP-dependent endonuclease of the OLD family